MERLDKIKLAIEKGITCNPETGQVFGVRGKEILRKSNGYVDINMIQNKKNIHLSGHQFVYYCVHKKVVDCIDHINGIKDDNRIDNLRSATGKQNQRNQPNAKGYTKVSNKYKSQLTLDAKNIYLGLFETQQQAHQVYLDAKEKYH
jgi:hypothetical protein